MEVPICINDNRAVNICMSDHCDIPNPFICDDCAKNQCYQLHEDCIISPWKKIKEMIEKSKKPNNPQFMKISDAVEQTINKTMKYLQKELECFKIWKSTFGMPTKAVNLFKCIQEKQEHKFTGKQVAQILKDLKTEKVIQFNEVKIQDTMKQVSEKIEQTQKMIRKMYSVWDQDNIKQAKKPEIKQELKVSQVQKLETKQKVEIKQESKKTGIKQEFRVPQVPQNQTILKLTRITDAQLHKSIKQKHIQYLLQLDCSNSLLTDQCGRIIKQLHKLQKLYMIGNNLTDKFIYHIDSILPSLIILRLAFTNIRDQSISLIAEKSLKLKQLDISYTLITSTGIMMLTKLTKLSSLAIWSGQDYYPQRYQEIINIGNNQDKYKHNKIIIDQQCIKQLCKLNLKEICINANGRDIDELILRMSKQSTCVEIIGTMKNKVIQYVQEMNNLKKVYFFQIKEFENKVFKSRTLRSFAFVDCNICTYQSIKSLTAKCNRISWLDLAGNKIGTQGVIHIAKNMKKLTYLNLWGNNIGAQGAIEITKNLKSLTYLNLGENNIGNWGAMEIMKKKKNLISLKLERNNIDNLGVMQIGKNMKNLKHLNLGWNNIGNQGAISIMKKMKNLTFLKLQGNNIDNNTYQLIKQMLPTTFISF